MTELRPMYVTRGKLLSQCAYGENRWQQPAGLYSTAEEHPLALKRFEQVSGNPMSYNGWCDLDRLVMTLTHAAPALSILGFQGPIVLGAKHGNCCGAAYETSEHSAHFGAALGDDLALYGGFVLSTSVIEEAQAVALTTKRDGSKQLLDGVVAPGFTMAGSQMLERRTGKCRLLQNPALLDRARIVPHSGIRMRQVLGGFLLQPDYNFVLNLFANYVICKERKPREVELDLALAWAVGSTSNSNTITLVRNGMLIGNGVGQQDRVGAAELAVHRAARQEHPMHGAVAYSDSFFPFPDGPRKLISAGVQAILTSKGSVRDSDTIELCEKHGIALYMIPDELGRGFFGH